MNQIFLHRPGRAIKLSAIIMLVLCLIIIPGSPARGSENRLVSLRVEGIEENIFTGTVELPAGGETVTALSVLTEALDDAGIEYEIKEAEFGSYVASIKNESEGTFGGYDGWIFAVNGELAPTGAGDYEVEENDEILFYYGLFPPDTLIPSVEISPSQPETGEAIRVTVTATYFDWAENKEVIVAVENAAVTFAESIYLTDAQGKVTIPAVQEAGTYSLYIDKDSGGGMPVIVRTGALAFNVEEAEPAESAEQSDGGLLANPLKLLLLLALLISALYFVKTRKAKSN